MFKPLRHNVKLNACRAWVPDTIILVKWYDFLYVTFSNVTPKAIRKLSKAAYTVS
jgi:hypothetical protein